MRGNGGGADFKSKPTVIHPAADQAEFDLRVVDAHQRPRLIVERRRQPAAQDGDEFGQ